MAYLVTLHRNDPIVRSMHYLLNQEEWDKVFEAGAKETWEVLRDLRSNGNDIPTFGSTMALLAYLTERKVQVTDELKDDDCSEESITDPEPVPDPEDWVCPRCGHDQVEGAFWVTINRKEITTEIEGHEYWCSACEEGYRVLVQRKDFMPLGEPQKD